LFLLISFHAQSTIIIPFLNLGDVMKNSDLVVYGEVVGKSFIEMNGSINERFQIKSVLNIKGNTTIGTILNVKNYHVYEQDREAKVWGDLSLDVDKRYLLFLKESNISGVYIAQCLSYYCFEELEIDNEQYLVPTDEGRQIHLAVRPDGNHADEIKTYKKSDLLKYLSFINNNSGVWNKNDKLLSVPNDVNEKIMNRVNPPSHCTFLFTSEPWSRWTGFKSQTLPVRYQSGGDNACSNAITYTQDAVTELNSNYTGIALTNSGPFSGYTPNCSGGNAYGGNFTAYCNANLGGSRNVCLIYNDPCSEIPDLVGCGGTLAIGGHYTIGTTHNHQGKIWNSAGYGFVVVNNNTGTCYCSVGTYQIMIEHELTHTLGIGHIDPGAGVANMNPSCCNTIQQLDVDCLTYTYPLNLPVTLSSFYGSLENEYIFLSWETAEELNNKSYIIEQSSDAINFNEAKQIIAQGTTHQKSLYNVSIPAMKGENYIRLAQIDFDNTKTYIGDLLSFRNEGSSKTLISAYYSSQQLHVSLPSEVVEDCTVINIYNTIGRLMNSFSNHETQNLVLDVSNLPTGVYFLNIPGQPILRFFKDN